MQRSKYGQPLRQSHDEALKESRRALKFESSPSDADSDYEPPPSYADSDSHDNLGVDEVGELDDSERNRWVPSPLTSLDGGTFKAEVDDHRVEYVKGSNRGAPSEMTMVELEALAKFFPWPEGIIIRLPCADGRSLAKYSGCIVVYEEALKAGFRFPLHPFICDFLTDTGLCPAQFTPNAWRCIFAFLLKFKELNLVPSYEAFKFMYDLKPLNGIYTLYFQGMNLITNPHNAQSWEKKWFLVCQTEAFHFNFPMYPGICRRCNGYSGKEQKNIENRVQGFVQIFKSLPKQKIDHKVLDACRLEEEGLSLHHEIGLPRPADAYEQYKAKRKRQVGCSTAKSLKMEDPTKKAKTSPSQSKDLASVKSKNNDVPQEEEDEEEDEDPEEDPEEEEEPEGIPIREIEVSSGFDIPSEGGSSLSTLCRPEVSIALKRLPEILLDAQHSEDLQRQLSECKQENVELKREKLVLRNQKAKELLEISTLLLKIKHSK